MSWQNRCVQMILEGSVVASVREQVAFVAVERNREGRAHDSKCAAMTEVMEEVCAILHCQDSEVIMRVREVVRSLHCRKEDSRRASTAVDSKRLTDRATAPTIRGVRTAGKRRMPSRTMIIATVQLKQNDLIEAHHSSDQPLTGVLQELDAIAPAVLRDYAEKRLRNTSKNGTIECNLSLVGRRMLQKICKFLDIKYTREQWKNSNRVQLFQSFVRNKALTVLEALPGARAIARVTRTSPRNRLRMQKSEILW
ncbi:hypothetical protein OSTOST_10365 [Ostertagia ostertagi]